MYNDEKKPFTAPLLVVSSFDQSDVNTASTFDQWSIGAIEEINK